MSTVYLPAECMYKHTLTYVGTYIHQLVKRCTAIAFSSVSLYRRAFPPPALPKSQLSLVPIFQSPKSPT